MTRAGVPLADLNNYFLVHLAPGADARAVAAAWLKLAPVETTYFEGFATEACIDIPPVTPRYLANQRYLESAPAGVDAFDAWAFHPAGHGVPDFWFIDVERGWNLNHEDLGDVAILNGAPSQDVDHGTAVLGEVVSCDGPFGMSGIANGITARMVNWQNEGSIAAAFDLAASYLDPGEIYLIEIHMQGPPSGQVCTCNCGQFEFVPMEWEQANFDAIQTHTAAGVVVVEAGGNGSMDLDGPQYNGLFNRSIRDSGAILVGAGTWGAHSPECWTNHGSRIDCQGFGSGVATTGYGDLFNPGDVNQLYTVSFSGTSSASPIVTGCAAVVQNLCQQLFGLTIDPLTLRGILSFYGTPQVPPLSRRIGVLPDLKQIIDVLYRVVFDHTPLPDTTDEANPYLVVATVTPGLLPESILSVIVHYSVSGGDYQAAALSPTGNPDEWQGSIPPQSAGNYVRYYLAADLANGPDAFFPAGGAEDPLLFIVGTMAPVVSDDLELPAGWTGGAPGDDATSGFWVHGDPHGTVIGPLIVAPEDDHTPAGTMAFVTGNPGPGAPPSDGDVDGGRTTLFSPLLDLSAELYLRGSLWVWSRFPGDDTLRIDLSNDAGQIWRSLARVTTDLQIWQEVRFEVRREDVPFTSEMQLRFIASDYGNQGFVEAGVDDLVIAGLVRASEGVSLDGAVAASTLRVGPATPNPFSATTLVSTTVPRAAGPVRLRVYDVEGRLVRTLAEGSLAAGEQAVAWDGLNGAGRRVAPGVYWIQLESAYERRAARVVKVP
jgi:hypothetical protein